MEEFCIHCGTRLYDEGTFCHGCGKPKAGTASVGASAVAPASESQQNPTRESSVSVQHTLSQQDPVSVSLKTPFGQVFSVTGKVLLALFLIGLGIGVIYVILIAAGKATYSSSQSTDDYHIKQANEKHTTMPESKWNAFVSAAIKQHCPAEGMTKAEVEKAIGKPQQVFSDDWYYERTIQKDKCLKYAGETCAEYETEHQTATFTFTQDGYMEYPGAEGGGWLYMNCFSEPFYSKHFKNF